MLLMQDYDGICPEPTKRRKLGKVTYDPPKKLKGVPSLTLEEQEAANIMQDLKESKKTSQRQPGTGGSSERTEDKLDDEEKDDKEGDADDEDNKTKSDEDDIYKYMIRVRKDEDEKMINAKVEDSNKGNEEVIDAAKADSKKTSEAKDDAKKTELPPTSLSLSSPSILSVPVYMISEPLVLTPVQESPLKAIVTTLPPPSVFTTPFVPQQTTTLIPTPTIAIEALIITTAISKSDALSTVPLRVAKLEKDMSDLKKIDLSNNALAALKTQVPSVIDNYHGSKVGAVFQKELKKHTTYLIQKYSIQQIPEEQAEKQQMPKSTIKSTDQATLKEYDQKSALYQTMHANKSFNRNPANHRLYNALMEALVEDETTMDKGFADTVQDHKRKHDDDEDNEDDDDEDLPTGLNQGKQTKRRRTKDLESSNKPSTIKETLKGKAPSKDSKTSMSASVKEPVEEPIAEVVIDDTSDDVVYDDDQPQDAYGPKTAKVPNPEWFTQPSRPPTPNPEWNKCQVVLDQPK
nr:hypothetical protein [Tanacetum cinerariifolium]